MLKRQYQKPFPASLVPSAQTTMPDALSLLKQYYGHAAFRPGQRELIEAAACGRDVLGILPTGGGKSVCYQIPALITPGLAVVVSPLISLMHDQVDALRSKGIPAAYITSELSIREQKDILENASRRSLSADTPASHLCRTAESGARPPLKFLYVSPERLTTPFFRAFSQRVNITLLIVDEAHCISMWGHEFRPAYLAIRDFLSQLPARPVVAAYTATATVRVREDIIGQLGLKNPFLYTASFDRPNLYYEVRHPTDKWAELQKLLSQYRDCCGIIYCLTRRGVNALARRLALCGYPALRYHAGLSSMERSEAQERWLSGDVPLIIATNAFGMGIDKPDVRFVIHYQMPGSVENYYQEAGRAGRDGKPSDCILLYSDKDVKANRFFIKQTSSGALREVLLAQLDDMRRYSGAQSCLRSFFTSYFSADDPGLSMQQSAGTPSCRSCSVCLRRGCRPETFPENEEDHGLYRSLIEVRLRIARNRQISPYKILPDSVLHDLAKRRPEGMPDLLLMEGTPFIKGIKYGADFLKEIRTWKASHARR